MDGDEDVAHATPAGARPTPSAPTVTVRYWAAARAAAGRESDEVEPGTLADVLARVRALHPDERFDRVVGACSVLVGERPTGATDPGLVDVAAGTTVELLPPFAGGTA